jgi:hypothetical protein
MTVEAETSNPHSESIVAVPSPGGEGTGEGEQFSAKPLISVGTPRCGVRLLGAFAPLRENRFPVCHTSLQSERSNVWHHLPSIGTKLKQAMASHGRLLQAISEKKIAPAPLHY